MDSNGVQSSKVIEQKTNILSRKVNDLGNKGIKSISVNADGSIPTQLLISKGIPANTVTPTDFKNDSGDTLHLLRRDNRFYRMFINQEEI